LKYRVLNNRSKYKVAVNDDSIFFSDDCSCSSDNTTFVNSTLVNSITGGTNVGAGVGLFKEKSNKTLRFKTLVGNNINISGGTDTIVLTAQASTGITTMAGSGLNRQGQVIRLGGLVTGDTIVNAVNGSSFYFTSTGDSAYMQISPNLVTISGNDALGQFTVGIPTQIISPTYIQTTNSLFGFTETAGYLQVYGDNGRSNIIYVDNKNGSESVSSSGSTQQINDSQSIRLLAFRTGSTTPNQILLHQTGITFFVTGDSHHQKVKLSNDGSGLTYDDDYSSTFVDQSLVNKSWVLGQLSDATGSTIVMAENGLTKDENNNKIKLGGAITANTSISTIGNNRIFSFDGSQTVQLNNSNTSGVVLQILSNSRPIAGGSVIGIAPNVSGNSAGAGTSHLQFANNFTFITTNAIHRLIDYGLTINRGGVNGTTLIGYNYRPSFSGSGTITNHYAAIFETGNIGVGVTAPTSRLHLGAGSTTVPPLKINKGSLVATITGGVNDGAIEYDTATNHFYATIGSTRYQLDQQSSSGVGVALFNGYTAATETTLNNKLNVSAFNTYSGTTAPATYVNKSLFNAYTGSTETQINNRLLTTTFNSYTGTTNIRVTNLEGNYISGATNLGTGINLFGSKSDNKLNLKSLSGGTNITLSATTNHIFINGLAQNLGIGTSIEYEDFEGSANAVGTNPLNIGGWFVTSSNGSASNTATGVDSTENAIGVVELTTGANSAGRCRIHKGADQILFGTGTELELSYRVCIPTLSTGTERFTVYAGYNDNSGAGNMTDGAFFSYIDNVNGGRWSTVTANNSSRTTKDSGVAPSAGVYQILTIRVDSTGNNVYFYIDGVLVQTHTSSEDIPISAGRQCGLGLKIEKSVGSAARTVAVDYVIFKKTRTTNR
jgi:hypothetical protein